MAPELRQFSVCNINFPEELYQAVRAESKKRHCSVAEAVYNLMDTYCDAELMQIAAWLRFAIGELSRNGKKKDEILKTKKLVEQYCLRRFLRPYVLVWNDLKKDLSDIRRAEQDNDFAAAVVQVRHLLAVLQRLRPYCPKKERNVTLSEETGKQGLRKLRIREVHWHFLRAFGPNRMRNLLVMITQSLHLSRHFRERFVLQDICSNLYLLSRLINVPCPIFFDLNAYCRISSQTSQQVLLQAETVVLKRSLQYLSLRRSEGWLFVDRAYRLFS